MSYINRIVYLAVSPPEPAWLVDQWTNAVEHWLDAGKPPRTAVILADARWASTGPARRMARAWMVSHTELTLDQLV